MFEKLTLNDPVFNVPHYPLPSIEGDCELAQQSGSFSDGGRAGGGFVNIKHYHHEQATTH